MKQRISTRFSMAIHILSLIAINDSELTGDQIALSVNNNPVVIRRVMGMLKKAGLLDVRAGIGGAFLLKAPEEITLFDIYRAVNEIEDDDLFLFRIHGDSSTQCRVGRNIEAVLHTEFIQAQAAMENQLNQTTLSQLIPQFK
ncbi:Rrf2 family transcriptional regulator [Paenibacillus sp. BIC5C1]|uniref:Rrf2 family transcriptional regulator n=1 Tax=Paenibacillus sp. BIC5C1 TaxID=3078263 RepID=UPI0037C80649